VLCSEAREQVSVSAAVRIARFCLAALPPHYLDPMHADGLGHFLLRQPVSAPQLGSHFRCRQVGWAAEQFIDCVVHQPPLLLVLR
jgi:hypothetical protein